MADRNTQEIAVSKMAFFAHTYDTPTFSVICWSLKTSMPLIISTFLMHTVFRNPAVPDAMRDMHEFARINFVPVRLLEGIGKKSSEKKSHWDWSTNRSWVPIGQVYFYVRAWSIPIAIVKTSIVWLVDPLPKYSVGHSGCRQQHAKQDGHVCW